MANNSPDFLTPGETLIRVCPATKRVVLAIYQGDNEVLDLHNPEVDQDVQDAINFVKQHSTTINNI